MATPTPSEKHKIAVAVEPATIVRFTYKNYKGQVEDRRVVPVRIFFGSTEFHPKPQWLLDAVDLDRAAFRTFALADVSDWWSETEVLKADG